jgi:ubiquitin carboxyl-terminal hydrolase 36/42
VYLITSLQQQSIEIIYPKNVERSLLSCWQLLIWILIQFLFCSGRTVGFCALCALHNHVRNALQSTGKIVTPVQFVKNLRCILSCAIALLGNYFLLNLNWTPYLSSFFESSYNCAIFNCKTGISRSFRNSRQEDAHELMVSLLESMHKSCLPSGIPLQSPSAYEKSLVHRIFGGRLRSQVYFC